MTEKTEKGLCVFCASSQRVDAKYKDTAREVGRLTALQGWRLLNGAGSEGLMAASAEGCQQAGGKVTGIIPQWMIDKGWLYRGLDEVVVTEDMAERKQLLRDRCDAVLVLPGGMGTMEELFETTTQKQLGRFPKPIVLLNQDGYYDDLLRWKERCGREGFYRYQQDGSLWEVIRSAHELFPLLNRML